MEFRDTPEEAEFRTTVRSFINENLPKDYNPADAFEEEEDRTGFVKQWRGAMGKQGWIAPHWPKEYGGAGMSVSEQFVFNEEMAQAHLALSTRECYKSWNNHIMCKSGTSIRGT